MIVHGHRVGGFHCISTIMYLLCAATDLALRPSPHPLTHRPLPIHRVSVTELFIGHLCWDLTLAVLLSRSGLKPGQEAKVIPTPFSVCVPTTPACWTQPLEMERWWSAAIWGWGEGQWRAGVAGKGWAVRPGFPNLASPLPYLGFDKLAYLPKPQLPHKENGNRSTYLEDWLWELAVIHVKHLM